MKSAVVGISGGIDSAVTLLLLKKQFNVKAVHLILYNKSQAELDEIDSLGKILKVPLEFIDLRDIFKTNVIDFYLNERLKGNTPSPCYNCNTTIKWAALLNYANHNNIDWISTGHYVRIEEYKNNRRIFKGLDEKKDQSYYLWSLQPEIINRTICPLGSLRKDDVRKIAEENELSFLIQKKESAGLCFAQQVLNENYVQQLLDDRNIKMKSGGVYSIENKLIGTHNGTVFYTIGQKKNLNLHVNKKLAVKTIDAPNNKIIVDTWQNLYTKRLKADKCVFYNKNELKDSEKISVKIRGLGLNPDPGVEVKFNSPDKNIDIVLKDAAWAPAPGQPLVFYKNDLVLGGGILM